MPGTVTFLGSGETSPAGGRLFEALARRAGAGVRVSVLETPAGFEANSERVARRVSEFLAARLQNYQPRVTQLAARKKGTPFSPDSVEITDPLYDSGLIFLGPGSPTYAARQLRGSLAWSILQARHRLGASLVFASAAAIAAGTLALPVYEIYKVGADPHWQPGLDFFAPFGLSLVVIPHWNNADGGAELDTSRCFMGRERFDLLRSLLPPGVTVLAVDELTAVTIDPTDAACEVAGMGSARVITGADEREHPAGSRFSLTELGPFRPLEDPAAGIPPEVWQQARLREAQLAQPAPPEDLALPPELIQLVEEREAARRARDWARADDLRRQAAAAGYQITDLPGGPLVEPISTPKR